VWHHADRRSHAWRRRWVTAHARTRAAGMTGLLELGRAGTAHGRWATGKKGVARKGLGWAGFLYFSHFFLF
jgi:hypothetical protein